MLWVAPIGLAFASDPGRAFEIGAEAAALADSDINSCLCAGVVSLIVALTHGGSSLPDATMAAVDFLRPVDCAGDVSDALKRSLDAERGPLFPRASVADPLTFAISAVIASKSPIEAMSKVVGTGGNVSAVVLAVHLIWAAPKCLVLAAPKDRRMTSPTGRAGYPANPRPKPSQVF